MEFDREQVIRSLSQITALAAQSIVDENSDNMFGFEEELAAIAHVDALRVYIERSTTP